MRFNGVMLGFALAFNVVCIAANVWACRTTSQMKFRWKGLLKSLQYFSIVIQLTSVIAVLMLCWADVDTPLYRIATLLRGVPIMSTYALIPFIIYLDFKLLELAALFDERIGNQTRLRNIILAVYCSTTVLPLAWQILDVAAPQWLDYAHLYSLA
ncbi:hypothetical protein HDU91_002903, partial [Kappamyces sp. JEL0680]